MLDVLTVVATPALPRVCLHVSPCSCCLVLTQQKGATQEEGNGGKRRGGKLLLHELPNLEGL